LVYQSKNGHKEFIDMISNEVTNEHNRQKDTKRQTDMSLCPSVRWSLIHRSFQRGAVAKSNKNLSLKTKIQLEGCRLTESFVVSDVWLISKQDMVCIVYGGLVVYIPPVHHILYIPYPVC